MSLYTDSQKLSDVPNHEAEEIVRDFILSFVTSKSGKSTLKIADEHLMSEDMVKRILQKWIKQQKKEAFESVLCSEIDDKRDFYWFWKHCEDKIGKKLSWYNVWTYFYESINLSNYDKKDIYRFFFHLYGMETTRYCILGGTLENERTSFKPVFIHDISYTESSSYYNYEEDSVKEKLVKIPVPPRHRCYVNPYEIVKLITRHNCDAYILAQYDSQPDLLESRNAPIKRMENILEQIGVEMIDSVRLYKHDNKFCIESKRLDKKNYTHQSYVSDIQDINFIGIFETDSELNADTKEADELRGFYNETFLRHHSKDDIQE